MPTLQLAHIHEQGQDMIIVPLNQEFGQKTPEQRFEIVDEIQMRATSAGLAGRVVPIWDSGAGRMGFIAPTPWHPFFQTLSLAHVRRLLNRTLSW